MNKSNYSNKYKGLTIILTVFLMVGCNVNTIKSTEPAEIKTQITQTPADYMPITATIVEQGQTTTPSVSPSPTSKPPTPTPKQTLSSVESKSFLLNLLNNNGGCRLPCIWGQTPGETDLNSIDDFMLHFGKTTLENDFFVDRSKSSDGKYSGITFVYWEKNSDNLARVTLNLNYPRTSEKVRILSFYSEAASQSGEGLNQTSNVTYDNTFFRQLLQQYMLPQILTDYGPPTKVHVLPYYDNPSNPADFVVPFSLILYYEEEGIYIEYLFPREVSDNLYRGCPSKAGAIILETWDPKSTVTLEEILNNKSVGVNGLEYTKSINNASSLTVDQFYQIFKNIDSSVCIETPKALWNLNLSPTSTP